MTAPLFDRHLAVCRSYQELIAALRMRVAELGAAGETIDDVAGLPLRYTMKLLAPIPVKALGRTSMGPLLGALGLKLVVVEDAEALEKIRRRLVPAKNAKPAMLSEPRPKKRHHSMFHGNPELARMMRQRGILALSPKQRSAIARKAAQARWRKPKPAPAAFLRERDV
jgi:hypothetical protein